MKAERIKINEVTPDAYQSLYQMNDFVTASSLTTTERHLIDIRASQINGCAFCVQMHVRQALDAGEQQFRIHALTSWGHSPFFNEEELIIIEMTEQITNISQNGLNQELYERAIKSLGEQKVSEVIFAITHINAWNRIGIATLLVPNPSQS